MASPHICGLLAYLLSIQGTETFNIYTGDVTDVSDSTQAQAASLYARAYSLLPNYAQAVLPTPLTTTQLDVSPEGDDMAPIPKITPAKLKKALIALASPGLLSDLPSGTPNLLAFNNATIPDKKRAM
jgi:cerevisin